MKTYVVPLDQIKSIRCELARYPGRSPLFQWTVYIQPISVPTPFGDQYSIDQFFWSVEENQLEAVKTTGAIRDGYRFICPGTNETELLDSNSDRKFIIQIPEEIFQTCMRKVKRQFAKLHACHDPETTVPTWTEFRYPIFKRHLDFWKPNVSIQFTDEARQRFEENFDEVLPQFESLLNWGRGASRNRNDAIRFEISTDFVDKSFGFVEREVKTGKVKLVGGIIFHHEYKDGQPTEEGSYSIHT